MGPKTRTLNVGEAAMERGGGILFLLVIVPVILLVGIVDDRNWA